MDDLPVSRIQISGPTLSSLLQRFSSSPGDLSGVLFGHVSLSTPSPFSDDTTPPSSSSGDSTLTATITSFLSSPSSSPFFFSPTPQITLPPSLTSSSLLGWFSARRKTPLRPSLRESSLSSSSSRTTTHNNLTLHPSIFLLLTTPLQDQTVHTYDYRAYQFISSTHSFEPRTLDVVNLGPAFRSHYHSFCPNNSPFPMLPPCGAKGGGGGLAASRRESKDQKELDMSAEGFDVGRLGRLVGPDAAGYKEEIEDLYGKMLDEMDGLARLVEETSARVLEQENHNLKLRYKVAGLE